MAEKNAFSALERYGAFTDLEALKAFSARSLRKSLRVNTLKTTVEAFRAWANRKGWKLEPVPWCPEAFFIDREDRTDALGRDLLHLLGHTYIQEAASMLPPALLDPQPGETILDMSSAPGSKTSQMSAMMRNTGVIVANDVQERRIWTLMAAQQRCGTLNTLVVKKVGQWYAKHMTERFDRVLVDAPCTAQGTVRKDSDALMYGGPENIATMARLQVQLLESAVHAAKVGGRIVYSTCTLTPEENEAVVGAILNKFCDQLEAIDPREQAEEASSMSGGKEWMNKAVDDSVVVQRSLFPLSVSPFPSLRLWPHVHDTEGFFCAVLRKTAHTRAPENFLPASLPAEQLPRGRSNEVCAMLGERYGMRLLEDGEALFQRVDQVLIGREDIAQLAFPSSTMTLGLPFCKRLNDGRVRIAHEFATLRGHQATTGLIRLSAEQLKDLLDGRDTTCDPELRGDMLLLHGDMCIGRGLAKEGMLKNALPREIVRVGATV
jgi:16S rRNA (cytosine1407-C5)-methyltransferase